MGRLIVAVALAGWAGIIAVAWRLASARVAICHMADTYTAEANCTVRAMAARDDILTGGLLGALALAIVALILFARRGDRPVKASTGWQPTSQGQPTLPR